MTPRTRVFISYSHRDKKHLARLQVHLAPYAQQNLIDYWDDTNLMPGTSWEDEIARAIDAARVAILLVSADFLASSYITEKELPRLLDAAQRDGLVVIPVIVGPCAFASSRLMDYQVVNSPATPLSKLNSHGREAVWEHVAQIVVQTLQHTAASDESKRAAPPHPETPERTLETTSGGKANARAVNDDDAYALSRASRTIFITDDDADVRKYTSLALQDEFPTYSFLEFKDGIDVLRHIKQVVPALLLLDVRMPGISGIRVLEEIATYPFRFPIILMSGDFFVQDSIFRVVQRLAPVLDLDQMRCLSKPHDLDTLYQLVHELLPPTPERPS